MNNVHSSLTSVTRWLLVVVGCAALEAAQPAYAVENPTPTPAPAATSVSTDPRIIYPQGALRPADAPAPEKESGKSSVWLVAGLLCAAGATWMFFQRRKPLAGRGTSQISIEESRSLGNRQYLVIARCSGKKFLLGVTPGRIQMLTRLDTEDDDGDLGGVA